MGFWNKLSKGVASAVQGLMDDPEADAEPGLQIQMGTKIYGTPPADCAAFLCEFEPELPLGSAILWSVTDTEGRPVESRSPYYTHGDDNSFSIIGELAGPSACVAVPFAALDIKKKTDLLLAGTFLAPHPEGFVVVETVHTPFEATSRPSWPAMGHFDGLIALCMGMANADGELDRTEVKVIREIFTETFALGDHQEELKHAMKKNRAAGQPLDDLIKDAFTRFPVTFSSGRQILGLLAHIAHADGRINAGEIEYLRQIHDVLGCDPELFDEILELLEMDSADAYTVLGLEKGADLAHVKQAYRKKMTDYHPDKYADKPAEFQNLANEKTAQFNEAYEQLCKNLQGGKK